MKKTVIKMLENELWWGGTNVQGTKMPFNRDTEIQFDLGSDGGNEAMPFMASNLGRIIWSDLPFKYTITNGEIIIDGEEIILEKGGENLREAFVYARRKYFPIDKRKLNREFFKTVQYNTWIECLYHPTQEHVLRYAHSIIDNGFEPGILMIDEGWHGRYGNWDFDRLAFPDPKKMVDELHAMGFRVLLWIVPCVCPDGEFFIKKVNASNATDEPEDRLFLRKKDNPDEPALFHWWNGYSAIVDIERPKDFEFIDSQLQHLINEYGIDGFKFDGGSVDMYDKKYCINGDILTDRTANEMNISWNKLADKYDFHEYKDTYGCAGKATIQRLRDRRHRWDDKEGLASIIPDSVAQGLIGYPFICPDMVGGGGWTDFLPGKVIDSELFVRWAQCSALFPMMQYSKAPWDCLSKEDCDLVLAAGKLHFDMTDEIIEMVERAEQTGEPILRNLEYNYPNSGYAFIKDEYMLEDKILVAPVLEKGARSRTVTLPIGTWTADDGKVYEGGKDYIIDCPIDRLIWFRKK